MTLDNICKENFHDHSEYWMDIGENGKVQGDTTCNDLVMTEGR